jgi:hypothetical protein
MARAGFTAQDAFPNPFGADSMVLAWDWENELRYLDCPLGEPGDRLWIRESHALVPTTAYRAREGVQQVVNPHDANEAAIYRLGFDGSPGGIRWRPSIHMPRWAARLTLAINAVRIERVQDITIDDAIAEGVPDTYGDAVLRFGHAALEGRRAHLWDNATRVENFAWLWDVLNAKRMPWAGNPWVWVLEFTVVERSAWLPTRVT